MYCPNCKEEYDDDFCPECGTELINKPADDGSPRINLGDGNAINGSLNVTDARNIHDDHSVHNTTIVQAQRTRQEILQDNENKFIEAVRTRVADGRLSTQEEAELDQIARDWKINPLRANQIIEAERKSAEVLAGGMGNEYYASKLLQNINDAVNTNQADILKRLFQPIEELAKTMNDTNVQYYYYMLYASLNPAASTISFVNHHTDNYWQLFWTCIAYVKLGQIQNATALLPRMGGFGCPHGDMDLLTAVQNLYDYRCTGNTFYSEQFEKNLYSVMESGISEQLSPLWYAVKELSLNEQHPEEWYAFYVETTLAELGPKKDKQMLKDMPPIPQMPQMPKFDPQAVQLKQSQGWNPLQAAQQMGFGQMPSMQDQQVQMNALCNQVMGGGMPPMPGMSTLPPMPQTPSVSQQPDAQKK